MIGLKELLIRYKGRCVAVQSHGYRRFIGKLSVVSDDYVVLQNATVFDDLEGGRWQDEATLWNVKEDVQVGFAETVISFASISAITSSDNEGLEPLDQFVNAESDVPLAEPITASITPCDPIQVQIGVRLANYFKQSFGVFTEKSAWLRPKFKADYCFDFPKIHVRDSLTLGDQQYSIAISGTPRSGGELQIGKYLAVGPTQSLRKFSDAIIAEPIAGTPAAWIDSEQVAQAEMAGLRCFDAVAVLVGHLREVLVQNVGELFNFDSTLEIVRSLAASAPGISYDFLNGFSNRLRFHEVLIDLLEEGLKLGAIDRIAEASVLASGDTISEVVDQVRAKLINSFLKPAVNFKGHATRVELSEELLQELPQIVESEELISRFRDSLRDLANDLATSSSTEQTSGQTLVLVVPQELRRQIAIALRSLWTRWLVISSSELKQSSITWQTLRFSVDSFCGVPQSATLPLPQCENQSAVVE